MLEVFIRLLLSLVFSGAIGFEREVSESNAGLKTHILVGVGATIVALMQVELLNQVMDLAYSNPEIASVFRSDPGRIIAQVVSGIGFLGAGTIIVTKRNISGLTTAASIWTVAIIGLALGLGFYEIAVLGFGFVIATLFVFKRLIHIHRSDRVVVKYLPQQNSLLEIENVFASLGVHAHPVRFSTEMFGDELIHTHVFRIDNPKQLEFKDFVEMMSKTKGIISVETTNIEG